MSTILGKEISALSGRLIEMGHSAKTMIQDAVEAMASQDNTLAFHVIQARTQLLNTADGIDEKANTGPASNFSRNQVRGDRR